jgi:hypothetical protein
MDESLSLQRKSHGTRALPLLAAGLIAFAGAPHAQTPAPPRGADKAPDSLRPLLGAWDLERVGASRKCTITLGIEPAGNGRQVRFPATCRRALPLLDQVAAWTVTPEGAPRLDDSSGKTVLAFLRTGSEAGLQGKTADGQQYWLDPKGYPRAARRALSNPAESAALAAQRPTAIDPARAPAADSLPGRYSVMRQQNREACKLVLTPGAPERAPAALEEPCQDTGLTIFDPAGWRYAAGRLTLVARKGHSLDLVFESGQWRKDPAVGAPLMMRRLP